MRLANTIGNLKNPESKHPSKTNRLAFIDALRGLASIAIILFHLVGIPKPALEVPPFLNIIKTHFGLGVTLFFIVSAYTLCLSADNRQFEDRKLLKFYIRRFFRIAPLFYTMLCFCILVRSVFWSKSTGWLETLANATFTFNLFPEFHTSIVWAGWSIGIEVIFYVLFPLIYSVFNNLIRLLILLAISLAIAILTMHFISQLKTVPSTYDYMIFLAQMPVFICGMIAYWIQKKVTHIAKKNTKNKSLISAVLLILFVALSLSLISPHYFWRWLPNPKAALYLWAINFGILLNLLFLNGYRLIVNPITCFYGKISYSAYLLHPFLIYASIPVYQKIYTLEGLPQVIRLSLCLLVTLAILTPLSMLSFRFIEKPGLRLGKQLIAKC
ncbi:MAG: acyltransferase [Cyanobacteria bacterium P01_D01_bin.44]